MRETVYLHIDEDSSIENEAILPSKNSRAAEWWAYSFVSRNAGREVAPPARIRF